MIKKSDRPVDYLAQSVEVPEILLPPRQFRFHFRVNRVKVGEGVFYGHWLKVPSL